MLMVPMGAVWASFAALMAAAYTNLPPLGVFSAFFALWLLPLAWGCISDAIAKRRYRKAMAALIRARQQA